MSTKPTIVPRWARTGAGADATNIATPSSGEQDTGWTVGQIPVSSSKMNWLFNKALLWFLFLNDSPAFVPTTVNAVGLSSTGDGTGSGAAFTGGATNGKGATGAGVGSGPGLQGTGGATGAGLVGIGGATSGDGVTGTGTAGNSRGGNFTGQGSAEGLLSTGGATGPGAKLTAGGGGSPARGALSLTAQATPSSPSDGDVWHDTSTSNCPRVAARLGGVTTGVLTALTANANYTLGAGAQAPKYYKTPDGVVHFHGQVTFGTGGGSAPFTAMPVGFRPSAARTFIMFDCNSTPTHSQIAVDSAGVFFVFVASLINTHVYDISNMSYLAEG